MSKLKNQTSVTDIWLDSMKCFASDLIPRPAFKYGNGNKAVYLSIQADGRHHCIPREGGSSKSLTDYTHLEIALWRGKRGKFLKPSDLGVDLGMDNYFEDDGPGAYVPTDAVFMLQAALELKYGPGKIEEDDGHKD